MRIFVNTLGSSALQCVTFDRDEAEVIFAKGNKYTYALQFGKEFASAEQIAESISQAKSAGAQFNKLVRDGVLVAV